MKYKQVKYIRRTPAELKVFNATVDYYMTQGYPRYDAEQRSWDNLFSGRRAKQLKTHLEVF